MWWRSGATYDVQTNPNTNTIIASASKDGAFLEYVVRVAGNGKQTTNPAAPSVDVHWSYHVMD